MSVFSIWESRFPPESRAAGREVTEEYLERRFGDAYRELQAPRTPLALAQAAKPGLRAKG